MAGVYDGAVQELIDELGRLPGIGPKSAQRIAFHLLEQDSAEVDALVGAIQHVKQRVHFCNICGNVTEGETCSICNDVRRLDAVICVVEEAKDIVAIERTREYRGRYHVLGGSINPIQGVGPEDLRIRELLTRLQDGKVTEVILATDPNIEGEATAAYLIRLLVPIGVSVSRLASGLPVGGDLEYADEITLSRAFEGRQRVHTAAGAE
ncbi:MAG: recombination mediator RecR [Ancrocorticia sp.]|uniref:recombination mediator RecR n=1 Tax=Ancrocorticia sp. TaxID=2593684 RepID=UPI003F91A337